MYISKAILTKYQVRILLIRQQHALFQKSAMAEFPWLQGRDVHGQSLSHVLTLCDPMDSSLPGSLPCPWISQARIPEGVAVSFSNKGERPGLNHKVTAGAHSFNTNENKINLADVY